MKKLITTIIITVPLFVSLVKAQDMIYSQPFTNPLSLNPSLMELYDDARFMLNNRNQWGTFGNAHFTTYSFTGFYPVIMSDGGNKLDVGLSALLDQAGAFSTFEGTLAVGYRLKLSASGFLSVSISGGYVQKKLDASGLTFDDQYVLGSYNESNATSEAVMNEKLGYPDINFGLLWRSNFSKEDGALLNAYAGISGFHLNQPNESFTNEGGVLARRFSFQGGVHFFNEGNIGFTPNVIAMTQGGATDIATGVYLDYKFMDNGVVTAGCWYRHRDAVAFLIKFEYKKIVIGYSYDIPNSDAGRSISGLQTHEVSLMYKLKTKDKSGISLF